MPNACYELPTECPQAFGGPLPCSLLPNASAEMPNAELCPVLEGAVRLDKGLVDMVLSDHSIPGRLVGAHSSLLLGSIRNEVFWDANFMNKDLQAFRRLFLAVDGDKFFVALSIAEKLVPPCPAK